MANKISTGVFNGTALVSKRGKDYGSRGVFVKLQGVKNALVYPTFGGVIQNPFKGAAKVFAGNLMEYRTNDKGVKPEIYILKTYEVVSADGTTINIARTGYEAIPFVGDVLTIAPDELGGKGEALTVIGVAKTTDGDTPVWAVTLATAPTTAAKAGDVLVDCDTDGNMTVKEINAVAPADYDFVFDAATNSADLTDFDSAKYLVTPTLGGLMYTHKMQALPACVKKLNTSKVNGWFKVGTWGNF
jgi:hypothetical protein